MRRRHGTAGRARAAEAAAAALPADRGAAGPADADAPARRPGAGLGACHGRHGRGGLRPASRDRRDRCRRRDHHPRPGRATGGGSARAVCQAQPAAQQRPAGCHRPGVGGARRCRRCDRRGRRRRGRHDDRRRRQRRRRPAHARLGPALRPPEPRGLRPVGAQPVGLPGGPAAHAAGAGTAAGHGRGTGADECARVAAPAAAGHHAHRTRRGQHRHPAALHRPGQRGAGSGGVSVRVPHHRQRRRAQGRTGGDADRGGAVGRLRASRVRAVGPGTARVPRGRLPVAGGRRQVPAPHQHRRGRRTPGTPGRVGHAGAIAPDARQRRRPARQSRAHRRRRLRRVEAGRLPVDGAFRPVGRGGPGLPAAPGAAAPCADGAVPRRSAR